MPAGEQLVGPVARIRAVRDAYGLTAEHVAERMADLGVPVDKNSLYNIERGAKKASDRVLDAYARALGVSPLDVAHGRLRPRTEPEEPEGSEGSATPVGPVGSVEPWQPGRVAGAVYRLGSGDSYAVEIRPGARVEVAPVGPAGPVTVTFSDPRAWPYAGEVWVPVSLVLPATVARCLAVETTRLIGWGELP